MKRENVVIFITVTLAVGLVVLVLLTKKKDTEFNWHPSYLPQSDEPFGSMVFHALLDSYFPGHELNTVQHDIGKTLRRSTQHASYVFIGQSAFYTDSTFHALKDFVYRGNDAFFAVDYLPGQLSGLLDELGNFQSGPVDTLWYIDSYGDSTYYVQNNSYNPYHPEQIEILDTRKNKMNFTDSVFHRDTSFQFTVIIKEEVENLEWNYFLDNYLEKLDSCRPLGTTLTDHFINYIQVPYGNGNFYIHVNPIAFTNYFLIQDDKREYTSKVLSYLDSGDIIWDEESRSYPHENDQSEGPLKYILSQRSLRWAWYCLIGTLLLYLAFRAKRMQQAIPVTEKNENKSLEFVQTIGRMYLLRKNHHQLGQQKIKLFYQFISERYKIPLAPNEKGFLDKLHLKSEIPLSEIEAIFKQAKYMENTDVNAADLSTLHIMLQSFYTHCK